MKPRKMVGMDNIPPELLKDKCELENAFLWADA
jgi:hypothetical protein